MEKLIVIGLILCVSAISNWLKKRKERAAAAEALRNPGPPVSQQGQANRPAPPIRPPQPTQTTSWEEELRRLLDGDSEAPAPPPVPRPRPIQPQVIPPPPVPRTISVPPPIARPTVIRLPDFSPSPIPVPTVTSISTRELSNLSQSKQAYERASHLSESVSAFMDRVPTQHVQPTHVVRADGSSDAAAVISMLQTARTARHAVIASVILGLPKALEDGKGII